MSPGSGTRWDAAQYARFQEERSRPFLDLLSAVPEVEIRWAADLGCGSGEMTRMLLERWPGAEVWGVDDSAEMLSRARAVPAPPGLHFVREDLQKWTPPRPLDLILSNAALQWVPDHGPLLESLAGRLGPAGILAVQVPNNRGEAAYLILDGLLAEPAWAERIPAGLHRTAIEPPSFYDERLLALGFQVRMWETIYHHRLAAPAEIVEWLKGTTLRPVLSALPAGAASEFLGALALRIASAYPGGPQGVVFPFRRLFFIARRA